jgi:hypothetical protein
MAFLQTHFLRNGTGEVNRFPREAYSSSSRHTPGHHPRFPTPTPNQKKSRAHPKKFPWHSQSWLCLLSLRAGCRTLRFSGYGFSLGFALGRPLGSSCFCRDGLPRPSAKSSAVTLNGHKQARSSPPLRIARPALRSLPLTCLANHPYHARQSFLTGHAWPNHFALPHPRKTRRRRNGRRLQSPGHSPRSFRCPEVSSR